MKLKLLHNYLSLDKFDEIEINDFSVITGINGSGKSHFLNAINNGSISIEGIDVDEVILYNYSDFNIFNITNNSTFPNQEITSKLQSFQNKSSNFEQKINERKSQVLNSFTINRLIEGIFITDNLLNNIFTHQLLSWSDDEFLEYENYYENLKYLPNAVPTKKHLDLHSFLIGGFIIKDIRNFIKELKLLFLKQISFTLIRQNNYTVDGLVFDENDVNKLITIVGNDNNFNFTENVKRTDFSPQILAFFMELRLKTLSFDFSLVPELLKMIQLVYKEILLYFEAKIDDRYILNSLKKGDGVINLNGYVRVTNGFFDLSELTREEKSYQLTKKQNEYNEFLHSKNNTHIYLDEESFLYKYGESPLSILNKVLEEYDCNGYEFRADELQVNLGTDINQQNINIWLFNKNGNYGTNLDFLSSGEKTLLALAFSIYKLRKNGIIAKVFLMDEVDSALHPLMSKRLINVLYNYFYKELGISIIVSTHSPSTVAFAPEDSLYVMKRIGGKRLNHCKKDVALKELTSGVPSFSINYENRRQIFVESKYDVEYYEQLYNIFKDSLNPEISLNFIASGDIQKDANGQPKSNCDNVIKITKLLRESGNPFIWGIIDWDNKKNLPDSSYVKVLGWKKRYSIENYLLDPLIVAILLLLEKIKEPSDFGFKKSFKIHKILSFESDQLQILIDQVVDWLSKKISIDNSLYINYYTVSGIELKLPKQVAEFQGHKLEEKYLEVFPELNKIKKSGQDNTLKNAIIQKVIVEYEELAPRELVDILLNVQEL